MKIVTDENGVEWNETVDDEGSVIWHRSHANPAEAEAYFAEVSRRDNLDKIGALIVSVIALIVIVWLFVA